MAKRSHPVQVWTFEVWTFDMSVPSALDAEELQLFVSCIASNFEISGVGNLLAFFHVDRLSVHYPTSDENILFRDGCWGWMLKEGSISCGPAEALVWKYIRGVR